MQKDLGLKLILIGVVAVGLMVPLALINNLVNERSTYRQQVEAEIADTWSGRQVIIGPVFGLPYQVRRSEQVWDEKLKAYREQVVESWHTQYAVPEQLSIVSDVPTEERSRGIYSVPVYTADISLQGRFGGFSLDNAASQSGDIVAIGNTFMLLSVSDLRGLGGSPTLNWEGEQLQFTPGTQVSGLTSGMHAVLPDFTDDNNAAAEFDIHFQMRGSQALQIAATGNQTSVSMQSPWPHPKFFGDFLPITRDINKEGFNAKWEVSAFSTDALDKFQQCQRGDCYALTGSAFGVEFVQPVDVYTKTERAVKYGILFIVLTFAAFFLIELMAGLRLHPVQYGLVGGALAMFYLLLLSLSEHLPFIHAYLIANIGCCGLLGVYLQNAMHSAVKGWGYALSVSLLYWMLYAILRSEDFALLMGCLLLFAALAAVMLLTRKVDWYSVSQRITPPGRNAASG